MRAVSLLGRLILVIAVGAFLGCASTPEKTVEKLPDWFLSPPTDPDYLFAAATSTSKNMQLAINKAKTQAQTSLAQQLEVRLGNLTKQFQEEVGTGEDSELLEQFTSATKVVTKQTLNGARTDQQELIPEKGIYRAYVLMSLPIGAANQLLMDKVKANDKLYTRFRATKAFDELNKELEAFEKDQ